MIRNIKWRIYEMVTIMIFEKHILYLINVSNCLIQMRNDHVSNPFYKLTHNHES